MECRPLPRWSAGGVGRARPLEKIDRTTILATLKFEQPQAFKDPTLRLPALCLFRVRADPQRARPIGQPSATRT